MMNKVNKVLLMASGRRVLEIDHKECCRSRYAWISEVNCQSKDANRWLRLLQMTTAVLCNIFNVRCKADGGITLKIKFVLSTKTIVCPADTVKHSTVKCDFLVAMIKNCAHKWHIRNFQHNELCIVAGDLLTRENRLLICMLCKLHTPWCCCRLMPTVIRKVWRILARHNSCHEAPTNNIILFPKYHWPVESYKICISLCSSLSITRGYCIEITVVK